MKFFRDSLLAACAVGICLTAIDLKAEKFSQNAPPSIQKPERKIKMIIRRAAEGDVETMADLSAMKREQYEKYQPIFHKRAEGARDMQVRYFSNHLDREGEIILVAGEPGKVKGFLFARVSKMRPPHDPGGKDCSIDDFVVAEPALWATTGKSLLEAVMREGEKQGAVIGSAVCGPRDAPKRQMLVEAGYEVGSEWLVRPPKPGSASDGAGGKFKVRKAEMGDLNTLVAWGLQKDRQYEKYQPIVHRLAADASEKTTSNLKSLIESEEGIALVATDGPELVGFAHAWLVDPPPVYGPGKGCFVDELLVRTPESFGTAGKLLHDKIIDWALTKGANLGNVPCSPKDAPKLKMLMDEGYTVASEFFAKPL